MSMAIPSTPATSQPSADAASGPTAQQFESLMGQNMVMRMQANQQALNKSMNKMTDAIKNSVNDEE